MISLTSTPQGPASGRRQGRSRRTLRNQTQTCITSGDTAPRCQARPARTPSITPTMWWELLRYPSDDAQAQVFWRRRMSVIAILVIVGVLLLTLFLQRGGTDSVQPTAAVRPSPAAPASSAAPPPPAPATSAAAPS